MRLPAALLITVMLAVCVGCSDTQEDISRKKLTRAIENLRSGPPRQAVVAALRVAGTPSWHQEARPAVVAALQRPEPEVRMAAMNALCTIGTTAAQTMADTVPVLIKQLGAAQSVHERVMAACALGGLGHPGPDVLKALHQAIEKDPDPRVVKAANRALEQLQHPVSR